MDLTVGVGYDDQAKQAFGAIATKFLKKVADGLGLKEKSIQWNKGGIAVSGEVSLYGMFDDKHGVYVMLSTPSFCNGILIRSITSMQDHTGGENQWLDADDCSPADVAEFIRQRFKERN